MGDGLKRFERDLASIIAARPELFQSLMDTVMDTVNDIKAVCSEDRVFTTDTNYSLITGLSCPVEAGKKYKVRGCIFATASGSGGGRGKVQLNGSAVLTAARFFIKAMTAGGSTDQSIKTGLGSGQDCTISTSDGYIFEIEGVIEVSADGDITVEGAQGVSSSDTTTFKKYSSLILTPID